MRKNVQLISCSTLEKRRLMAVLRVLLGWGFLWALVGGYVGCGLAVECTKTKKCEEGKFCVAGLCKECKTDRDCRNFPERRLCHPRTLFCVNEIDPEPSEQVSDGGGSESAPRECVPGQTRTCYTGRAATRGLGVCRDGLQSCQEGRWGACEQEIKPSTETCDGVDNDCDGQTDEGCPCTAGQTQPCGSATGECKQGTQTCSTRGQWGECTGQALPKVEKCDGKDNDCNGKTDEGLSQPCYSGVETTRGKGECKDGVQICQDGKWGACTGDIKPEPEVCNKKDDDCDGKIDEDAPQCVITIAGSSARCSYTSTRRKYTSCNPNGDALQTRFAGLEGITVDRQGVIFLVDPLNHRIRKLDKEGKITTIAGDGRCERITSTIWRYCYRDGAGTTAQFHGPRGITVDTAGNLYVTEAQGHRVRKITPAGVVSTVAGRSGTTGSFADGSKTAARFNGPSGLVIDPAGNLYVADYNNHRIRKIDPQGNVTTLAGGSRGYKDGPATEAQFNGPIDIALDFAGNLYVADYNNHRIRKIDPQGNVTTHGKAPTGQEVPFDNPRGLALDDQGNLYVANFDDHQIARIDPNGTISKVAGNTSGLADGTYAQVLFSKPIGLAMTPHGQLLITDNNNRRVRLLTFSRPEACTKEKPRSCYTGAEASRGKGICKDGQQVCLDGAWSTCMQQAHPRTEVCNGQDDNCSGKVDDPPPLDGPLCAIQDGKCAGARAIVCNKGTWEPCAEADYQAVYAAYKATESCDQQDENCNTKVDENAPSCTTTIAGTGTAGYTNGPGTAARFSKPSGITMDAAGNLYVADTGNHRLRKIDKDWSVSLLSGSGSTRTANGSATASGYDSPSSIVVDSKGNFYVTTLNNAVIRKVTPTGASSFFAGSSTPGNSDGTGTAASFGNGAVLAIDSSDNLYVADTANHSIRKVTPAGVVTTIAGGTSGYEDGTGPNAKFHNPTGIAVDAAGDIYVGDSGNLRIRKISGGLVSTIAGDGTQGFADGQGLSAKFQAISALAVSSKGVLYILDVNRVRVIDATGKVTTIVANDGGYVEGTFDRARFNQPKALVVGPNESLYIADTGNNRLRLLNP